MQPQVDRERKLVRIPARLQLQAFAKGQPPGHHLITWSGGRAGKHALLLTPVSDAAILSAFEALGARPGDTLVEESWTERANPQPPAPDLHATGPRLEIQVVIGGPKPRRVSLEALVVDVDERGFEWRLAGNRALIQRWRSGCVVCLQSCPGSKIANAKATMRHLEQGRSRFRASALALELGEDAELWIELRWVPAPPAARPAPPERR